MTRDPPRVDREAVRERLDRVTDPELDRSIVELDYIDDIQVGETVYVRFKLPTAWCSPAFAWMMATDIHEEVGALPDVVDVEVDLVDHMHAEEITRGVNERLAFEAVFEDASEGVEAVRATLDDKARLARQYRAVEALLDAGLEPGQIVDLTRRDVTLNRTAERAAVTLDNGIVVYAPREPLAEYVEKAREVGVVTGPDSQLFTTPDGEPIPPGKFKRVHHRTRAARVNMGGQGAVCDALHRARYDDVGAGEAD